MTIVELLKTFLPSNQAEAAKLINVSQPAIHKWMTGKCRPSPKNAVVIERATEGQVTRYQLRPDVFGAAPDTHQDRIARSMESPCTPTVST